MPKFLGKNYQKKLKKCYKKPPDKSIEKENKTKNRLKSFYKFKKFYEINTLKEIFKFIYEIYKVFNIKKLSVLAGINFQDPFTTGVTLGAINSLIPFFPYDIKVFSDFSEESSFELDVYLYSEISLYKLIACFISFSRKSFVKEFIFAKGDFYE